MTHLDKEFLRYGKEIRKFAKYVCKDQNSYEDLVHDVYIKVKRAELKGKYKEQKQFLPWIKQIIKNALIDKNRAKLRKRKISMESGFYDREGFVEITDLISQILEDEESIEEAKEEHEEWLRFEKAYDKLNPIFKEVVELNTFQNITFKQIAKEQGISIMTALGRKRYAVIELKKELNL